MKYLVHSIIVRLKKVDLLNSHEEKFPDLVKNEIGEIFSLQIPF